MLSLIPVVRLVKRGLMFSDGSQSHFWELWAGEYLLFCQCTRCGTKRRRSELFFCYKSRLVSFFLFFFPLFVSLARCTATAFKSDRKVFNRDELGQLRVERLQRATRWLLKTRLKHQRRHQRRQTREVSSERQKKRVRVAGGWLSLGLYTWFIFFLGYTDSVGDWSSVFGLISWTLVRIFFWCPAKDTPILWRSLQHTKTKMATLMWLWRKCSLSYTCSACWCTCTCRSEIYITCIWVQATIWKVWRQNFWFSCYYIFYFFSKGVTK